MFRDPSTRPKAIAVSLLLGGTLAYGAYQFWIHRAEVAHTVAHGAHAAGQAARDAGHAVADATESAGHKVSDAAHSLGQNVTNVAQKVEGKIEATLYRISHKLAPARDRVHEFKQVHLERFVKAKQHAITEDPDKTLSLQTLSSIQQLVIEMSEKDFRKSIRLNREERRKLIAHQKHHYEEVVIGGMKDFEQIFEQNLSETLKECGVSQDKYNDSIAQHVNTDPNIYLVGPQLHETMVLRLPAVNTPVTPTKDYAVEVYAVEVYAFMVEQYPKIMYHPISREHYTEVKDKMLIDRVHEKYQLEEEDIKKLRRDFDSLELRNLIEKYDYLIIEDENKHGNFPRV